MNGSRDFDRRIGDWLEEGPQNVPEWLVDRALDQAHAMPQLGAGRRLPWTRGPRRRISPQVMTSLAAGALGALAVVIAFGFGLMAPRFAADESPSPSPSHTPLVESIGLLQVVDVLPGRADGFYTLIGMAATREAVWTVAVVEADAGGAAQSVLIRIDARTGDVASVPLGETASMLSPPAASEDTVWTGSAGALHRVDAGGGSVAVTTIPLAFDPAEISVADEGLWIAHEEGTSLVDPASGETLRTVSTESGSGGRIVGAPAFGSLWACRNTDALLRIDPASGETVSLIAMPRGATCHGRARAVNGVLGLPDRLIPGWTNMLLDPATNDIDTTFETGGEWFDFVVVDETAWFVQHQRGGDPTVALVELDTASGRPARVLTMPGRLHQNTTFDSEALVVAGDHLWVLADSASGESAAVWPEVVRIPLTELRGGQ